MTVPGGAITQFEVSPCKQYLVLAKKAGDPQLWHIMSNTLVGTFKGEYTDVEHSSLFPHLMAKDMK